MGWMETHSEHHAIVEVEGHTCGRRMSRKHAALKSVVAKTVQNGQVVDLYIMS